MKFEVTTYVKPKQTSVISTLQVELLDASVLVPKNSKVAALGNSYRGDSDVEKLFRLLNCNLRDAVVCIAPQIWLSSA